jgi:hypothetical protein
VAVAGGPLVSAGCIGSSDPAIPGGENSGFGLLDDAAEGSPGEDDGDAQSDAGASDAVADGPTDAAVNAQADGGPDG